MDNNCKRPTFKTEAMDLGKLLESINIDAKRSLEAMKTALSFFSADNLSSQKQQIEHDLEKPISIISVASKTQIDDPLQTIDTLLLLLSGLEYDEHQPKINKQKIQTQVKEVFNVLLADASRRDKDMSYFGKEKIEIIPEHKNEQDEWEKKAMMDLLLVKTLLQGGNYDKNVQCEI